MLRRALFALSFAAAALTSGTALASPYWGSFQDDGCKSSGYRQYSAILWGIPLFQSWEATCAATPADVAGQHFDAPSRCVNKFWHEWGEFDVLDLSCGMPPVYWHEWSYVGCGGGYQEEMWTGVLDGAPADDIGLLMCERAPATLNGWSVNADSCWITADGRVEGLFYVPSDYCW
jgi:hypothetical protein